MTDRSKICPKQYLCIHLSLVHKNGGSTVDWSLALHDWLETVLGCFYGGIESIHSVTSELDPDFDRSAAFVISRVEEDRIELGEDRLTLHW